MAIRFDRAMVTTVPPTSGLALFARATTFSWNIECDGFLVHLSGLQTVDIDVHGTVLCLNGERVLVAGDDLVWSSVGAL